MYQKNSSRIEKLRGQNLLNEPWNKNIIIKQALSMVPMLDSK